MGNAPAALQRCMQLSGRSGLKVYGVNVGCGAAGMLFASSGANSSYAMSRNLLQVRSPRQLVLAMMLKHPLGTGLLGIRLCVVLLFMAAVGTTSVTKILQGLQNGVQPQYGALVFNDNVTQHVADRVGDAVSAALPQISRLFASAANWTDWQQQLGGGAAVAWSLLQASPEGRHAFGRLHAMRQPIDMHTGKACTRQIAVGQVR